MKFKINVTLSILLLLPFILNICGRNIYLYVNTGEKDIICASASGFLHCAFADKMDFKNKGVNSLQKFNGYSNRNIIESESVNLFLEPSDSMEVFTFNLIESDGYHGFEFPWLLFWSIPTFLAFYFFKKKREVLQEPKNAVIENDKS